MPKVYFNIQIISINLRRILKLKNITIVELAEATGIAFSTIQRIVNATTKKPKQKYLEKICAFLNIEYLSLIGEKEINWSRISGWLGNTVNNENKIKLCLWELAKNNQLQLSTKSKKNIFFTDSFSKYIFCLEIDASRVIPKFDENTILICDPQKKPENGDYVIVKENKYSTLKMFKFCKSENKELHWFNPINNNIGKFNSDYKIIATVTAIYKEI